VLATQERAALLVHGDLSRRNIIMRSERRIWQVSAFIDWERACAGTPLVDIGHVLRYEGDETAVHLERGFIASGGTLPKGWLRLARLIDAVLLLGALTEIDLPKSAALEIAVNHSPHNRHAVDGVLAGRMQYPTPQLAHMGVSQR
jgi:aminoglycoside phosphotransferase (APT) family kinase protein